MSPNEDKHDGSDGRPTVAVAGASGFIGRAIAPRIDEWADLVGLSRGRPVSAEAPYEWRSCDLFSRSQTIEATRDADLGIYLVHSMEPKSSLTQGHFRDLDLLCADNFAAAAQRHGFDRIVYVGGIIPDEDQLSTHLTSRLEVEHALARYGTPVTTLRAGLVVGRGGSSTQILVNLVRRLPVIGLPRWTRSKASPIDIDDMAQLVSESAKEPQLAGRSFEVGGSDDLSYAEMLRKTAEVSGKRRLFIPLPFVTPRLSTMWVSLFGGYSRRLVRPLVESLRHDLRVTDRRLQNQLDQTPLGFEESIRKVVLEPELGATESDKGLPATIESRVPDYPVGRARSVQRLPKPDGSSARWVAREYARWVPDFLWPFVDVKRPESNVLQFHLLFIPWALLVLTRDAEASDEARELYWISGGWLSLSDERGRLEFREALDGGVILAALHDFRPRLPWLIYRFTQALIHRFVMWRFGRHLETCTPEPDRKLPAESD